MRLANNPFVGHYFYKDVMARLMLCSHLIDVNCFSLFVPTVETVAFKKEKIKEYGS